MIAGERVTYQPMLNCGVENNYEPGNPEPLMGNHIQLSAIDMGS